MHCRHLVAPWKSIGLGNWRFRVRTPAGVTKGVLMKSEKSKQLGKYEFIPSCDPHRVLGRSEFVPLFNPKGVAKSDGTKVHHVEKNKTN